MSNIHDYYLFSSTSILANSGEDSHQKTATPSWCIMRPSSMHAVQNANSHGCPIFLHDTSAWSSPILVRIPCLKMVSNMILGSFCLGDASTSSSCQLGPWGQWSPCSRTCGSDGIQERTRQMLNNGVQSKCKLHMQRRICVEEPCPKGSRFLWRPHQAPSTTHVHSYAVLLI